jgi:hypothetical protein
MTRWLRAVAIVATALAIGLPAAQAADLDYYDPGPRRFGSAYDDPRYADLYGDTPARPPSIERHYAAPYPPPYRPQPDYAPRPTYGYGYPPIPREPVYRDDYAPRRYVEVDPYRRGYEPHRGNGCLGKEQVRWQLERQGWQDFHDPYIGGQGVAFLKARRPSGRLFQLQVDRCSGEIIQARPLEPRHGPFADYDQRPRYRY